MIDTTQTSHLENSPLASAWSKVNAQVIILGLIALITLFQTFQLVRINAKAGSTSVKATVGASVGSQTQNNAVTPSDVPQSMVGGC